MPKTKFIKHATSALLLTMITQAHAAIKSIDSFTETFNHFPGFYSVYVDPQTANVYLDVDKLDKPFLLQHSLPYGVGSNDIGLDRGQLGGTYVAQFERIGDKVLLKALNTYYRASAENAAEKQSVQEAFASSVLQGFKVVAEDSDSVLIDYTPYLMSDVHGVSRRLADTKQGNFSLDNARSAVFLPRTKAFVKNTELEATLTFGGSNPGEYIKQVSADPYAVTVHQHHSLIELPDDKYQPRQFHPQSGYWSIEHKDYSAPLGQSMYVRYIPRHRLEKKDPSAAVSEAVEPIIYYLDPGVPEPVRSALLEGASWWNSAFEAAGYKNAFQVKMLPESADPMDVRYNVIQWVHRATRGWSYGSSVIDPRTGEILKGHVTLGSLRVRQDILIAESLAAPFKTGNETNETLQVMALDRIRQLSAHEVGHTLGIAHNFSASVKDRASVMDYPHPLLSISDKGELDVTQGYDKGIGIWDKQVIKYGYGDFTQSTQNNALKAVLAENKTLGLEFISDDDARAQGGSHPTAHLWDNGNDPADELNRVLEIRQKALSRFGIENLKNGEALSQLEERLVPLYLFHRYQVEAAVKLIGGEDYSYEVREEGQTPHGIQVVARERQLAALKAILKTLTPKELMIPESVLALVPPKAYGEYKTRESVVGRTGLSFDAMALPEVAAAQSLSLLLNPERVNRLIQQKARDSKNLGLDTVLFRTYQQVFETEEKTGMALLLSQRTQILAAKQFAEMSVSDKVSPEAQAMFKRFVHKLAELPQDASLFDSNKIGKATFKVYLAEQIRWFQEHGKWADGFKALPLPPGSPI
ncbi:zinc-dependent metalloprotease [Pseudoalteromonas xiamenensis]